MQRSPDMLPAVLIPLAVVMLEYAEQHDAVRDLDTVDLFAGKAAITSGCTSKGLNSEAYDKSYLDNDSMDITTGPGFLAAFHLVLRLRVHGSLWGAPVCSSWVFMSRSVGGRSSLDPAGNLRDVRIRHANSMVVLFTMLALLAWLRGAHIWLEQPVSSIMFHFSPLHAFCTAALPFSQITYMGAFGGSTCKPLIVKSTTSRVAQLACRKPTCLKTLASREGSQINGKQKELKLSQAYPRKFGLKVATIMRSLLDDPQPDELFCADSFDPPCKSTQRGVKRRPTAAPVRKGAASRNR